MTYQHKQLQDGGWAKLNLIQQMANIGSEVERAIKWREKNTSFAERAFNRALELFDLSIQDKKNQYRLKEITRCRELFAVFFVGDNKYQSTPEEWQKYFRQFNFAARINV